MGYVIRNCDEQTFIARADDFSKLCRQAFAEHIDRNVKMGPCYMTSDKWIELSRGCIGQYIEDDGGVIAFWLVYPDYKKKETYGKILAVAPEHKGNHLGLSLSRALANYLRELGMNVFMTDTSLKAPHVVKFHKSYGCKAIGMTSWPNTNYYSVILRLALTPECEISDREANKRFRISRFKCKMLLKEDGSATLFGKIYNLAVLLFSKLKYLIGKG
ncbi:MAG: GNAT family N-acetyltransferase [Prevotella sp.]|nr:GNAT family N-acetyltransferase [Prevotella sp.]